MGVREAYIEKVSSQLKEWRACIDQHTAAGSAAVSHWQVDAGRMAHRLEDRLQRACRSLAALHNTPDASWLSAKNEMERALIDLKIALDESGAGRVGQSLAMHAGRAHVFTPFSRKA